MFTQFGQVALLIIIVALFLASMPLAAFFFRLIGLTPHKPNPVKQATYESGMQTVGKSWVQFNIRYYTYALMFVALDVTAVLIYAWAVDAKNLAATGFIAALVFLAILAVAYLYALKKKALEWK